MVDKMNVITLSFIILLHVILEISATVRVDNFAECSTEKEQSVHVSARTRTKGDGQQLQLNASILEDIGNKNKGYIRASRIVGQNKIPLTEIPIKGFCKALTDYGTTMYQNAARKVGIDPTKCPIPKKNYFLDWYDIDYDAIVILKMIPPGHYHIRIFSNKLICLEFEAEKK